MSILIRPLRIYQSEAIALTCSGSDHSESADFDLVLVFLSKMLDFYSDEAIQFCSRDLVVGPLDDSFGIYFCWNELTWFDI